MPLSMIPTATPSAPSRPDDASSRPLRALASRAAMLVLYWLALSLESAAWLALTVLVLDGLGWWSPLLPSEPTTRLGWVAAFSALSAAGRLVDRYLRPTRS